MSTTISSPSATNHRLTPRVAPEVSGFLDDGRLAFDLMDALGSPLNVLFPSVLAGNVSMFTETFERHGLLGRIFFAHKCNQSDGLMRQLALEKSGVDVSSVRELQHALGSGFVADRIEATGPKSGEFIALCVQQGVWMNVDSISELQQVIGFAQVVGSQLPARVLLRLSGFKSDHSRYLNKGSRFGIPLNELQAALALLQESPCVELAGFSFHLDTVSVPERTIAIENCFDALELAVGQGFAPRILDIGGGYKVNYLEKGDEWNQYTSALKEGVLGTAPSLTWHGNSFGLHAEKGTLRGNFNSYTYYDEQTGGRFLDELLSQRLSNVGNGTVGSVLRDNMIELWVEPGRALVNQCGVTLSRVNNLRYSSNGDLLVNLAMKRQDISFLDQEIFVDPVMLSQAPTSQLKTEPVSVFFAGNLCLESDLIYRHKTFLAAPPKPGDIAAFVNTAGYFMDFSATESIMQPLARKVVVIQDDGRYRWFMDDCFWPLKARYQAC